MEKRDLYWVQQLIVERTVPSGVNSESDIPTEVHTVLGDVRMMVKMFEDSMVYMRRWCRMQGWKGYFTKLEKRYYKQRSPNHPCRLLEPYIIETPTSGALTPKWRPKGY